MGRITAVLNTRAWKSRNGYQFLITNVGLYKWVVSIYNGQYYLIRDHVLEAHTVVRSQES